MNRITSGEIPSVMGDMMSHNYVWIRTDPPNKGENIFVINKAQGEPKRSFPTASTGSVSRVLQIHYLLTLLENFVFAPLELY